MTTVPMRGGEEGVSQQLCECRRVGPSANRRRRHTSLFFHPCDALSGLSLLCWQCSQGVALGCHVTALRAGMYKLWMFPGRCPGLSCYGPSGRNVQTPDARSQVQFGDERGSSSWERAREVQVGNERGKFNLGTSAEVQLEFGTSANFGTSAIRNEREEARTSISRSVCSGLPGP